MNAIGYRYSLLSVLGAGMVVATIAMSVAAVWTVGTDSVAVPSLQTTVSPSIVDSPETRAATAEDPEDVAPSEIGDALGLFCHCSHIVPAFEGGRTVGMKVISLHPGSLADKLGVQRGDIIKRVNGIDVTEPASNVCPQSLFDRRIVIDFVRAGKPGTLTYSLE